MPQSLCAASSHLLYRPPWSLWSHRAVPLTKSLSLSFKALILSALASIHRNTKKFLVLPVFPPSFGVSFLINSLSLSLSLSAHARYTRSLILSGHRSISMNEFEFWTPSRNHDSWVASGRVPRTFTWMTLPKSCSGPAQRSPGWCADHSCGRRSPQGTRPLPKGDGTPWERFRS